MEYGPPLFDVGYMEGEERSDFWRYRKIDSRLEDFILLLGWTNALGVFFFNSLSDMLDRCSFTLSFFIVLILSLVHVLFALFFIFVISINEVYYLSKKLNQH